MSDPLRVAIVAEGPTDRIVIEAALEAMLPGRSIVPTQLQPEGSLASGLLGSGWAGVYRWCHSPAARGGGRLGGNQLLFQDYDVLILHLDADVAAEDYAHGSIVPVAGDRTLPCEQPCPPASATTDALRGVLLSWCGETSGPTHTVICMPSTSTEAWVIAALFPNDRAMSLNIECYPDPESRLGQQPKKRRIRKSQGTYRAVSRRLTAAWPSLGRVGNLSEARRFEDEVLGALKVSPATGV